MKRFITFLLLLTGIVAVSAAQSSHFRQEGIASYYGQEFAGRPTASGEIFNPGLFTAAHKELPFGTILTVTNKQNMRQVTVRINDRGPFVAARIIDLSRAAAEALDMISSGIAPVIIEQTFDTSLGPAPTITHPVPVVVAPEIPLVIIQPTPVYPLPVEIPNTPPVLPTVIPEPQIIPQVSPPPAEPVKAPVVPVQVVPVQPAPVMFPGPPARIVGGLPPAGSTKSYRIQVGAYKIPRNAVDAFTTLKNAGLDPAYERHDDFYRVVLLGLKAGEISSVAQTLGNHGFREAIIREEN